MKILFLCGSLEPGQDGVGDYTRRLAGECIRQGHQAQIIALNERHLAEDPKTAWQTKGEQDDYGTFVEVWRWPNCIGWAKRGDALREILSEEKPDVVSIQFVPYSYNIKGLPFGFVWVIRRLAKEVQVQWQVMFHELWIGRQHSPLGCFIGPIQKRLCLALPKKLPSPIIHTHLTQYIGQLSAGGLAPQRLPLFGNIPVFPGADIKNPPPNLPEDAIVFLHFGTFSPQMDCLRTPLQSLLDEFSDKRNKCHFVSIGSAGPHRDDAHQVAVKIFGKSNVHFMGTLSPEEVSAWMQRANVGISRSPLEIYEKSGSTAAMLEHGLDVRLMHRNLPPIKGYACPDFPPQSVPTLKQTTETFLQSLACGINQQVF